MIYNELRVSLQELVSCISEAIRLVSPDMAKHHNQVAYISYKISDLLGYREEETMKIILSAAMHDIGAISLEEKLDSLRFEDSTAPNHAELGYLLMNKFAPFKHLAPLVRYHHYSWNNQEAGSNKDEAVPIGSHLIHLADRTAVLIKEGEIILSQKQAICDYLKNKKNTVFNPEHVDAFIELADKEYFWLDCVSQSMNDVMERFFKWKTVKLDIGQLIEYTRFLSRIVDFRSPLNANHSSGVAASAVALARLARFSDIECSMMLMAGYLHDIGKLAIPTAILEKPGSLDENERNMIKTHSYFSYSILTQIKAFDTINKWASFHHERLDGRGYPFQITKHDLPLGSQIMAVADIYTALNEERTYRKAMSRQESIKVMNNMVNDKAINGDLVALLDTNFDEIDQHRRLAQQKSSAEYRKINPLFAMKNR